MGSPEVLEDLRLSCSLLKALNSSKFSDGVIDVCVGILDSCISALSVSEPSLSGEFQSLLHDYYSGCGGQLSSSVCGRVGGGFNVTINDHPYYINSTSSTEALEKACELHYKSLVGGSI